jgi:hypothetical protein
LQNYKSIVQCVNISIEDTEAAYFVNSDTYLGKIKAYKIVSGGRKRGKIVGQYDADVKWKKEKQAKNNDTGGRKHGSIKVRLTAGRRGPNMWIL